MGFPNRLHCTEAERTEIHRLLAERRKISDPYERDLMIEPPEAARDSLEGGLIWGVVKVYQDQPALLFVGSFCLVAQFFL